MIQLRDIQIIFVSLEKDLRFRDDFSYIFF